MYKIGQHLFLLLFFKSRSVLCKATLLTSPQASLRVPNGNATVDFHGSWEPSEDAIALFDPLTGSYRLELISSQASLRHAPGPTRERQADKGPSPMKRRKKAGQPPAQTNDESGKDLERLKRPPTEEAAVLE